MVHLLFIQEGDILAKVAHCMECKCEINKDIDVQIGNRWRCLQCNNKVQKEKQDRKELYDYICDLYELDIPTTMMMKQIKEFKENYNYKYKGMLLALQYWYEILEKSFNEENGLGIIPYIYNEAKKHYIAKQKINSYTIPNLEEQTIIIKPSQTIKKVKKLIDINDLVEE